MRMNTLKKEKKWDVECLKNEKESFNGVKQNKNKQRKEKKNVECF